VEFSWRHGPSIHRTRLVDKSFTVSCTLEGHERPGYWHAAPQSDISDTSGYTPNVSAKYLSSFNGPRGGGGSWSYATVPIERETRRDWATSVQA